MIFYDVCNYTKSTSYYAVELAESVGDYKKGDVISNYDFTEEKINQIKTEGNCQVCIDITPSNGAHPTFANVKISRILKITDTKSRKIEEI